jgi:hypothetical protein
MMRQDVKDDELERMAAEYRAKQEESTCAHYWLIDSAEGHISRGVCKFCGEEREFLNSVPAYASLRPGAGFFDLPGLSGVTFDEPEEGKEE